MAALHALEAEGGQRGGGLEAGRQGGGCWILVHIFFGGWIFCGWGCGAQACVRAGLGSTLPVEKGGFLAIAIA